MVVNGANIRKEASAPGLIVGTIPEFAWRERERKNTRNLG